MILTVNYKGFSFDVRGEYVPAEREVGLNERFEIDRLLYKGTDFTELILAIIDPQEVEQLCLDEIEKM